MSILDQYERFQASERQEWHNWLEKNYATSPGVWLISYKQTSGKPRVSYADAVEEALCFGWIDSKANKLDDERSMQLFTPRRLKSPWSTLNKQRIEKLLEQGLMAAPGLEKIEAAKRDGSWNAYDEIEVLTTPDDLKEALATNPTADSHFQAFSDSTKKQILWHIASAKRPETRSKRIEQIVHAAEQNKNPLAYTPKQKV